MKNVLDAKGEAVPFLQDLNVFLRRHYKVNLRRDSGIAALLSGRPTPEVMWVEGDLA